MGKYFPIVMAGVCSLIALVVAALLDFFKREPRYRYNVYSKSDSERLFYVFFAAAATGWTAIALMRYSIIIPEIGWPVFALANIYRMVLLQQDFTKRRTDVANLMFRLTQYEFVAVVILLVGISYYVHSKPA